MPNVFFDSPFLQRILPEIPLAQEVLFDRFEELLSVMQASLRILKSTRKVLRYEENSVQSTSRFAQPTNSRSVAVLCWFLNSW